MITSNFVPFIIKKEEQRLVPKPQKIFTDFKIFTYTYSTTLHDMEKIELNVLDKIIGDNLNDFVICVNSNWNYRCLPQYMYLDVLKTEETVEKKNAKKKKNNVFKNTGTRKQGNGTCFHSAFEPVLLCPEFSDKPYKSKCFSTAGRFQICGGKDVNFDDCKVLIHKYAEFLTSLNVFKNPIQYTQGKTILINYKTALTILDPEKIIIKYLDLFEILKNIKDTPWKITELKKPEGQNNVTSFKFIPPQDELDDEITNNKIKKTTVRIFASSKINILNAFNLEHCEIIQNFLTKLFDENWDKLISYIPENQNNKQLIRKKRRSKKTNIA